MKIRCLLVPWGNFIESQQLGLFILHFAASSIQLLLFILMKIPFFSLFIYFFYTIHLHVVANVEKKKKQVVGPLYK